MIRDSSISCLSDDHLNYMFLALLGIIIYYPLSTFMFPNIQFGDGSLDLKYTPEYLVIYVQYKLLALTISSFFTFFGAEESLVIL